MEGMTEVRDDKLRATDAVMEWPMSRALGGSITT